MTQRSLTFSLALVALAPTTVLAQKMEFGDFAEQQAHRAELQGRSATVRHWREQQRMWLLEQRHVGRAEELESRAAGETDPEKARALKEEAELARVHAEAQQAERLAAERQRTQRERVEEDLGLLVDKATVLRQEGHDEEAAELEAEMTAKLRAVDPDSRRINELRKRMVRARLDGRHADADLFRRAADRLRGVLDERYGERAEPAETASRPGDRRSIARELRELRQSVAELRETVAGLARRDAPKVEPAPATPPVEGVVTSIKDKLVEISIGTDDGLRNGHRLIVVDEKVAKYLGRIEIVHVTPDRSVGRVIETANPAVDLVAGHRVRTTLGER